MSDEVSAWTTSPLLLKLAEGDLEEADLPILSISSRGAHVAREARVFTRVRLTDERWQHVIEHAEMKGQLPKLRATLRRPDRVLLSRLDTSVHLHYRWFERTPVTSKHLMVAVKDLDDDAFVITVFFTGEVRGGAEIWAK